MSGAAGMGAAACGVASRGALPAPRRWRRLFNRVLVCGAASAVLGVALAAPGGDSGGGSSAAMGPPERSVDDWLVRLRHASTVPSFVGTYVVTAASGAMASARIWHLCEGNVQLERVDSLSGAPRSTFRRNDEVSLVLPGEHLIRTAQREAGGRFPNLLSAGSNHDTAEFYSARNVGHDRVAGLETDIVQLDPRDALRYGYRIWSEQRTGLVLKTQTLDPAGTVIEQSAFSEVQLDPPLRAVKAQLVMPGGPGYRSERVERVKVDAAQQGWQMKRPVAGFEPQGCYRRTLSATVSALQWVFSDGLATVSLFVESFDARRHTGGGVSAIGATHALSRRWPDAQGAWWVTLVGEVPPQTLTLLFDGLARQP